MDVTVEDDVLKASFGRAKTAKQPKKAKLAQIIKKNARRALVGVGKQAGSVRPDLKVGRRDYNNRPCIAACAWLRS